VLRLQVDKQESKMNFIQNPTFLSPEDTMLFIVDVQEKLLPAMTDKKETLWNIRRLIEAAKLFDVPILVTEQYPQGLGQTTPDIKSILPEKTPIFQKKSFSACLCHDVMIFLEKNKNIQKIILCGIENHVCVLQTALDLLAIGCQVNIVTNAVTSRFEKDCNFAFRRMETSGVFLCTTESVIFELCRTADAPQFKTVSRLIREKFTDQQQ